METTRRGEVILYLNLWATALHGKKLKKENTLLAVTGMIHGTNSSTVKYHRLARKGKTLVSVVSLLVCYSCCVDLITPYRRRSPTIPYCYTLTLTPIVTY